MRLKLSLQALSRTGGPSVPRRASNGGWRPGLSGCTLSSGRLIRESGSGMNSFLSHLQEKSHLLKPLAQTFLMPNEVQQHLLSFLPPSLLLEVKPQGPGYMQGQRPQKKKTVPILGASSLMAPALKSPAASGETD